MSSTPAAVPHETRRGRRVVAATVRAFHLYANWLVGLSWKRFALLALLLLVAATLLQSLPPFSWRVTETVPASPVGKAGKEAAAMRSMSGVEVVIDADGARSPPQVASAAAPGAAASRPAPRIEIKLPPGLGQDFNKAVRTAVQTTLDEHREAAGDEAELDLPGRMVERTRRVAWGDFLTDLALLWVVASIIVKATYTGRMQAEAQAARATESAESEVLKRQVVEARLAAMQAQVEPHFLFNTLASIDHLIETDAPRASRMQKNLIALLRASMPSLRETQASGVRDLGRELAVVRPYLEILKMRMEERLQVQLDVPQGLLSAEFPPMMMQSLVENAIKHGLEPKAEGGALRLHAEIVHGKLALSVADTGLGYGKSATAGTGVGLANIRERLAMLYGAKAALNVADNPGGGTLVTITVPYRSLEERST